MELGVGGDDVTIPKPKGCNNFRRVIRGCSSLMEGWPCRYCWSLRPSDRVRKHQKLRGKKRIRRYEAWELAYWTERVNALGNHIETLE